jgi:hypothetical protein
MVMLRGRQYYELPRVYNLTISFALGEYLAIAPQIGHSLGLDESAVTLEILQRNCTG